MMGAGFMGAASPPPTPSAAGGCISCHNSNCLRANCKLHARKLSTAMPERCVIPSTWKSPPPVKVCAASTSHHS